MDQVTTFANPKVQGLRAMILAQATYSRGLKDNTLDPDQVSRCAQACGSVPGEGSVSTFMPELLDDLASVHGQGRIEAQANASDRAANHGPDLFHDYPSIRA